MSLTPELLARGKKMLEAGNQPLDQRQCMIDYYKALLEHSDLPLTPSRRRLIEAELRNLESMKP